LLTDSTPLYILWFNSNSNSKFLKNQLETSKSTCSEEEYRQKASQFGIEIYKLQENPGLRFIAKICLNSLWGKFGQNAKVKHSKYIDSERTFYRLILNDKIDQISLSFLNDIMVYAKYEMRDEFIRANYNTNLYIACFTTSWARLRLMKCLKNWTEMFFIAIQIVYFISKMNKPKNCRSLYRRRAGRKDRRVGRKLYEVLMLCTIQRLWIYSRQWKTSR